MSISSLSAFSSLLSSFSLIIPNTAKKKEWKRDAQNISKPVDSCSLDGIFGEEIMRHKCHSSFLECVWSACVPYFLAALAEELLGVLDDEGELRVYCSELDGETACESCQPLESFHKVRDRRGAVEKKGTDQRHRPHLPLWLYPVRPRGNLIVSA